MSKRSPAATDPLADLPSRELRRELNRRSRKRETLLLVRAKLAARIARIDAELAKRPARRAPGTKQPTMARSIARVLEGCGMTAGQIARAVEASGYRTSAARLDRVVATTLAEHPERFVRVKRGVYRLA